MSRYFALQTWVGSHENEPDYDGNQCGSRNVRSVEAIPLYDIYGKANVNAFSDSAIAARMGKTPTKVPLKQRILPQATRVEKLRSEILELETAYRAGEFSLEEYSVYRDVAFAKLQRAEVLYKRAISAKPIKTDEEIDKVSVESAYSSCDVDHTHTEVAPSCGVSWMSDFIDDLPPSNSFKSFLKMSCKVVKTAVHYKHKISSYIDELKVV